MAVLLREVTCPCGVVFWLCSACDRGHRYCSAECRLAGRQRSRRRARRKYAHSERGRRNNRERQRRFRQRHRGRRRTSSKKRNGSLFSSRAGCAVLAVCRTFPRPPQSPAAGSTPDPGAPRPSLKLRERPACARCATMRSGAAPEARARVVSSAGGGGPRCHLCGRAGRVVRRRCRRGRFRWSAREPPPEG